MRSWIPNTFIRDFNASDAGCFGDALQAQPKVLIYAGKRIGAKDPIVSECFLLFIDNEWSLQLSKVEIQGIQLVKQKRNLHRVALHQSFGQHILLIRTQLRLCGCDFVECSRRS
jgi:hypothetical protein